MRQNISHYIDQLLGLLVLLPCDPILVLNPRLRWGPDAA